MAGREFRLSRDVRPERYDVHLRAAVDRPEFDGELRVALRLERPASSIVMHARGLEIRDVRAAVGERTIEGRAGAIDPASETIALTFPEPLPSGDATLALSFRGMVGKSMTGLYRSSDGAEACLATQCEEAEARSIFPCFDEPSFKASLAWTITTTPDVVVLANGPLARVERGRETSTWRFAPTPPMPSYLAALAIGKLRATDARRAGAVPLRVWAMEGKEHLGEFGRDLAAQLLPWFEAYFGQAYPFGKYDQVAVPSFSMGAMENAGLVVFRASLLLRDPRTTSWRQEKVIARVIAHEMAHMWFGNLVTMEWWDDIWLNESFAEWMGNKATHAARPDDGTWEDFHADKRRAQRLDALASTHAVYAPIPSVRDVGELFDAITYEKGAAVMRMLEAFLGEDAFRAGLRSYMEALAFRNARGEHLWKHLEEASGQPVSRLMASWVLQPGFPIVSARLDGARLRLSQRRAFLSARAKPTEQTWLVPLVVRYADDAGLHETRHLMEANEEALVLPLRGALAWCTLNADAVGFYRQELDPALRKRLVTSVHHLTAPEQMDLIEDAWALAQGGSSSITDSLDLIGPTLRAARTHAVLALAAERLDDVEDLLHASGDPRALDAFRAFVRDALRPETERLGSVPRAGEPRDDAERRAIVLETLAMRGEDPDAIRVMVGMADREADDAASVDASLAGPAVRVAAKFGDAARIDRHLAIYDARRRAGAAPSLTDRYLGSFSAVRDAALLQRVLDRERAGFFPLQAVGPLLRAMLWDRDAREAAWGHLRSDWARLRAGLGDQWMAFLVDVTGELPPRVHGDMARFFEETLGELAKQSRERALESVAERGEFEARCARDAAAWFAERKE